MVVTPSSPGEGVRLETELFPQEEREPPGLPGDWQKELERVSTGAQVGGLHEWLRMSADAGLSGGKKVPPRRRRWARFCSMW